VALRLIFVVTCLAVLGLRFEYCLEQPANTGDVLRHARYGLLVAHGGLAQADVPLQDINPGFERIAWSERPFNYPVLTLGFDALVMAISPTLFSLKLALTLVEALAAIAIFLYSRDRWLALSYWCSPISIWWVSHEGQFESLQSLTIVLALLALRRNRALGWLALALAIQVKLFAVFMIPYFLLTARSPRQLARELPWFACGFLPTAVASFFYSPLRNMFYSSALRYNAYYWNFLDASIFNWNPPWLIAANQLASWGAIIALLALVVRGRHRNTCLAAFGFLLAMKVAGNVQVWYLAVLPAMLLAVEDPRLRRLMFLLTPLLDVSSLISIVSGPFGYTVGRYYRRILPLSPLDPLK
jgi:hypothetical protein